MGPLPSSQGRTNDDGPVVTPPEIDPISQQILDRTKSPGASLTTIASASVTGASQTLDAAAAAAAAAPAEQRDGPGPLRASSDAVPAPLARVDAVNISRVSKDRDKKKGVSFLSRFIGSKKRDELSQADEASTGDMGENRLGGNEAEIFSGPVGFIPRLPGPPKYIKVKAHNGKKKSFDRLFLAQILLGQPHQQQQQRGSGRRISIDSKIRSIDDGPLPETASSPPPRKANKAIWAMEVSKDGRYLAAGGQDKKVRVWEVVQLPEDRDGGGGGGGGGGIGVSIGSSGCDSPGGSNDGGEQQQQQQMKLHAPVFKQTLVREYDGHTASILDLSWSKNNFLLSSSMDKTVRLYHVSRPECLCAFRHNDFVTSIQFHPRDDRFFLAGSLDSRIRLWSIPDRTVAYSQNVGDMVTAVAFTPDGRTAIAGTLTGLCILYHTEGLTPHSQIHVKSARGKNSKGSKITGIDTIAIQQQDGAAAAAAAADVKLLITSNDSRIRMYNLRDRALETKFRGNQNSCSQIHATFSDDGKYVICGSEDRKVYVWPTSGAAESGGGDGDKHPHEVFEAHSSIATTAVLLPTASRRLLAQSSDPIYDLCNPPPVTLLSRADSVLSSPTPDQNSTHSATDDKRPSVPTSSRLSESPRRRAVETPAYLARHDHYCGMILVTADYSGQIKVFRQDCAYQKRRLESWDDGSTFPKKGIARSGSSITRYSTTSSRRRNQSPAQSPAQTPAQTPSLGGPVTTNNNTNGSSERILNWRNSIRGGSASRESGTNAPVLAHEASRSSTSPASPISATTTTTSATTATTATTATSQSTSWTKRISLHLDGTRKRSGNHANATASSSNEERKKRGSIAIATPSVGPNIELIPDTPAQAKSSSSIIDGVDHHKAKAPPGLASIANTRLMLVENSYDSNWNDLTNTLVPTLERGHRTPVDGTPPGGSSRGSALLVPGDGNSNPRLSRAGSYVSVVSELSSELTSSDAADQQQSAASSRLELGGGGRQRQAGTLVGSH